MGADRKPGNAPGSDTTRGFAAGVVTATVVMVGDFVSGIMLSCMCTPSKDTCADSLSPHVAVCVQLVIGRFTGPGAASVPSAALPDTASLAAVAKSAKALVAPKGAGAASALPSCGACTLKIRNPEGNPLWDLFKAHKRGPLVRKW